MNEPGKEAFTVKDIPPRLAELINGASDAELVVLANLCIFELGRRLAR